MQLATLARANVSVSPRVPVGVVPSHSAPIPVPVEVANEKSPACGTTAVVLTGPQLPFGPIRLSLRHWALIRAPRSERESAAATSSATAAMKERRSKAYSVPERR